MRLIDHFDKGASRSPDRAFLIDDAGIRTYAQSRAASHRIANALARAGVAPGTKAAVYSANAARAFECLLGIVRAGAVWVPVNVRNTVADSAYTLRACDVELLFYQRAYANTVRALREQCPGIRALVCIDGEEGGVQSLDVFTQGCEGASPEVAQGDDDLATLY